VQQGAERSCPLVAEVDVVVRGAGRQVAGNAGVPHDGTRREVPTARPARRIHPRQHGAIGHRQIGGAHDGIGTDHFAGGQAHAAHPTTGAVGQHDPLDALAVGERHPGGLGGAGHRHRQGVHAADRDAHAVDRIHVGDDRVQRQRLLRRQPGVHRLEAEDPHQTLVAEEPPDRSVQPTERTGAQQPQRGTDRVQQVER
jgi:hypothetical protein